MNHQSTPADNAAHKDEIEVFDEDGALSRDFLEQQARALGVPLEIALIPPWCSNDEYENSFSASLENCRAQGISILAAGDLYLEDVRAYREDFAKRHGLSTAFPLWGSDTTQLAQQFITAGFQAILTCVDTHALGAEYCGRAFDDALSTTRFCATCLRALIPAAKTANSTLSFGTAPDFLFPFIARAAKCFCAKNDLCFAIYGQSRKLVTCASLP